MDDFRCLKALQAGKFTLLKDTMKFVFMMDLYTQASRHAITPLAVIDPVKQEFNIRFLVTHTTHVYPEVVAMALFKHLPWYIRGPSNIILPLVDSGPLFGTICRRCRLGDCKRRSEELTQSVLGPIWAGSRRGQTCAS